MAYENLSAVLHPEPGRQTIYPEGYDSRFDPTLDENYRLEEFVNQSGVPSHRWIYTFTDGDYNAALKIWQAEEQE